MSLERQPLHSGDENIAKQHDVLTTRRATSDVFEESSAKRKKNPSSAAAIATVSVVSSEQLASVHVPPRCPSKSERHQEYLTLFLEEKLRRRQRQKRRRYN